MKIDYARNNWSAWRLIVICYICAAIFTGCGLSTGDGTAAGVGTGGTGSVAKVISGTVADGYLVNATVFLDKNGNDRKDIGEPSTNTDTNGAYSLTVDFADIGKCPIVAQAVKGLTIDKDTNQAISNNYILSMPKESVSDTFGGNFISPISTWVHKTMTESPDKTLTDVMTQLRVNMNLPGGMNMLADYVRLGSATPSDPNRDYYQFMHTAAQNMVPILAQGQPFRNISTALRGKMGKGMVGR
jgi:hypothetical protein